MAVTPVIARNEAALMPLGSTFKLYVLATLARDVAQGRRAWDDVVPLEQRSYPSGILQDWPQGSPVTLHTLATLMISISDNTATDALIAVLGRDNVYATMSDSGHDDPRANDPFLTTRELFMLKGGPQPLRTAYQSGDRDERARILAGLSSVTVDDEAIERAFAGAPVAPEIEWFASARDIADLFVFMRATADLQAFEIMSINPGLPDAIDDRWAYAGYKGGSEPGVLHLAWLLTDEAGRGHVLALGWSDPDAPLDESRLDAIARRILALPG